MKLTNSALNFFIINSFLDQKSNILETPRTSLSTTVVVKRKQVYVFKTVKSPFYLKISRLDDSFVCFIVKRYLS